MAEQYSGTNAVALSICLRKPVQTLPQHHYCEFLRDMYIYAVPLEMGAQFACLAVMMKKEPIIREVIAFVQLLSRNMEWMYMRSKITAALDPPPIVFSKKQRLILLCLAKGMQDKETAAQLQIGFDTVRFHKRNLYRLLEVDCAIRAVVKALRSGIIRMEEVDMPLKFAAKRYPFG